MALPKIDAAAVSTLIPGAANISEIDRGGQKLVFRADIDGKPCALKFLYLSKETEEESAEIANIQARAAREVEIMKNCDSQYMVKTGPIELQTATINGERVAFFSEELVEGTSLDKIIRSAPLSPEDTVLLGLQISNAIESLWKLGKVHRDIKPKNIMRRSDGRFVLLDAGLAFDTTGDSLSHGFVVGTFAYFSPEQFDYSQRRILDFRSDQFSLGVTLYEACTGIHPFMPTNATISTIFSSILKKQPAPPSTLNPKIGDVLDRIILQLLGKSPHLRFRRMDKLIEALESLEKK
jgi:serine/threonine protein kinase